MNIEFANKTVLLTGGTRGIGAALADAFHKAGAKLILTGTRADQTDELNRQNAEASVTDVEYWPVDFTDNASLEAFLARLDEQDRIDVCINSAGINPLNPIESIETADLDATYAINLRAPFLICRSVSKLMKRANYGRIVNIASIWSVITKPHRSVYTATKAGLSGMTQTLAAELAADNILVNAVSPGFVLTELTAKNLSAEQRQSLAAQVPIQRFAKPEELASTVLFLSSDLNTYLTGQNIVVDGGFTNV
jgi:3-oxoacyl-[acyl-carrier protein] reductase